MRTEILETELYEIYIQIEFYKKGISFQDYKKIFLQSQDSQGVTLTLNIIETISKEIT